MRGFGLHFLLLVSMTSVHNLWPPHLHFCLRTTIHACHRERYVHAALDDVMTGPYYLCYEESLYPRFRTGDVSSEQTYGKGSPNVLLFDKHFNSSMRCSPYETYLVPLDWGYGGEDIDASKPARGVRLHTVTGLDQRRSYTSREGHVRIRVKDYIP
ncbi:hypothetical protein VNO77_19236 [Canavalia gladiata]|uniref:Secreted protein n=1 Tax=Canavalia gladiata TaxID=3824 RepID=A0AAN9LR67_CANGL